MADLDYNVLNDQLQAAGRAVLALKRKPGRGYQGPVELDQVVPVVRVICGDGVFRYVEPSELTDGDPDVFVRDYVKLGESHAAQGLPVVDFLKKWALAALPAVAGGKLAWLWNLLGGGR